jgi:hypothetical protein
MQPLLRRHRQAALFGHGDEITEVSKLHGKASLKGMAQTLQNLSPGR